MWHNDYHKSLMCSKSVWGCFFFYFMLILFQMTWIHISATIKMLGLTGLSSLGCTTGLGKCLISKFEFFCWICGTVVHYFSVISSSKKCGLFCSALHHYKQITYVVHLLTFGLVHVSLWCLRKWYVSMKHIKCPNSLNLEKA